jgi:superfamily II DNA helicase RecQ
MKDYSHKDSTLRLVVATTVFGLGIDGKDIIHWGAPTDLEQYLQETGWAGRDGRQEEAILYDGKVSSHIKQNVHGEQYHMSSPHTFNYVLRVQFPVVVCCDVC